MESIKSQSLRSRLVNGIPEINDGRIHAIPIQKIFNKINDYK